MFLKASAMESTVFFLEMKEECKVFCVKLILWSVVAQKGTDILIFYIFEYGAEYGAECSAESGAKYISLPVALTWLFDQKENHFSVSCSFSDATISATTSFIF